ncbi:centromere protein O-like [Acanthaster planci]|uniref:Centromere protein O n=1 Tax=Acanthaster planci TaxID=133434 RepID=A0A8B7ZK06_ACAPL|nr:centromere protein O-like [Acanthaster planci]XP_022103636.1 centromere protein O-like [Acanthaster planci]XP_022103637.1 centromere protein O-like [Acanthaster planci]XP_022103639.1 centromere protein O-like [Acanthaster planci]XP_022103640.1 centromere protein O-like [Acanthaster planci]XP_022103641.1 centromere protein O-like [Acanthaster planci]XP_022103642.1 centromere protein O-like [Acanthaster planci]XP_022103643.1 centromere protein O-like [Acanthaster planci]
MDDSRALKRLAHGTLHSLQRLEDMTHDEADEKESVAKQQRQLLALQKSLQQLNQLKDRLTYKLNHGPSKILSDLLGDEDADIEVGSEAQHAAVTSSVAFAKRLKTLEFLQAYRLSGVTVTSVSDRRVRLRWETFYQGEYHEPYYMELEFKGHLQVYRHTLPHFLPLTSIAEAHLNEDLTCFVDEIGDLLNAYVSRQQQVAQLKVDHSPTIIDGIHHSQSLDYIQITLLPSERSARQLKVDLYYDDLHATRPTKVHVSDYDDVSDSALVEKLKSSLKQSELSKALSSVRHDGTSQPVR